MKGTSLAYRVAECCVFPSDFTEKDIEKFGLEVASEAGRYLPDGDVESIVEEITGTSKSVTVKYGKTVHKSKENIAYSFRLSVVLAISASLKLRKVTGFEFPIDLSKKATFWSTWNRAEVKAETKVDEKPVDAAVNK